MTSVSVVLLIGIVLAIAVAGNKFFAITRLPNPLILMVMGICLGPILHWISVPNLDRVTAHVGTLALLLILFEGGLELELDRIVASLIKAASLGLLTFFFSFLLVAIVGLGFGLPVFQAAMLGLVLGGASPSILLTVLSSMGLDDESTTLFTLDCTISELLCVISVLVAIQIHASAHHIHGWALAGQVVEHILLSMMAAFAAGLAWGRISNWMSGVPLSYMLTLSVICLLYSTVHYAGGDGGVTVLFFGAVLANAHVVANFLRRLTERFTRLAVWFDSSQFVSDELLVKFNVELSFLIRTFFFFLLGMMCDFKKWSVHSLVLIGGMLAAILAARWLAATLVRDFFGKKIPSLSVMAQFFVRGGSNGTMALLAIQAGLFDPDPSSQFNQMILSIIFGVILTSNLAMAVSLQFHRGSSAPDPILGPGEPTI